MKRLLFLALVVFAAWYGYHHYKELRQEGSHQVIAINHTGHPMERLRISVGNETVVMETLENGATAKQSFKSDHDGSFQLTWKLSDAMGDRAWTGGTFSHGPILLAHTFDFREGDGVIYSSQRLATK
jgi:hypothetical protein